jgi:hypothetical protein
MIRPELPFLDGYSGQSTDELIEMYGRYRTDSLVLAFEQALLEKMGRSSFDALSREERVVLAIEAFEREVNNGGFDQFFLNAGPQLASIVVDAFDQLGCHATASIARAAAAANSLQDQASREAELSRCDDLFYAGQENIEEALFVFIRKHGAAINASR